MSMAQITAEISPSGEARCPHCHSVLPTQAQFCISCGERVRRKNSLEDDSNFVARYRKTSLLHRRPFVSLFFASDARQQRQIALRDIDISSLSDDDRANAYNTMQHEYDLLRQQNIPVVMPAIDMGYFQGHLFTVAGWPTANETKENEISLYTLQDVLQSGKGLPSLCVTLSWIEQLCRALSDLHQQGIVIGDLDPHTLLFDRTDYTGSLTLMISWLPATLYKLFPHIPSMNGPAHFTAPEVLLGHPEPRSDIYSLGAVLYLLLTGTPPEEPAHRIQHRLRPPGEIDTHINSSLDDFVLQALALDTSSRFESAQAMLESLTRLQTGSRKIRQGKERGSNASVTVEKRIDEVSVKDQHVQHVLNNNHHASTSATTNVMPEDNQPAQESTPVVSPDSSIEQVSKPPVSEFTVKPVETPAPSFEDDNDWKHPDLGEPLPKSSAASKVESGVQVPTRTPERQAASLIDTFKQRISGLFPAIPNSLRPGVGTPKSSTPVEQPTTRALVPIGKQGRSSGKSAHYTPAFLKHLQNAVLGEQKRDTTAAVVIETPLRVQPEQAYAIRIQLMGRNKQQDATQKGSSEGGISTLAEGDVVHIEVRSVLYQNYAYVVQQANVSIPAEGYAAEVTIPMQPLSNGPGGRRDRLHVFFMDTARQPFYEKPFVLEIFISHLVHPGREGHNVLTIPL
jgi:serine/threonine protein kinase